jgi:hypothetical protein
MFADRHPAGGALLFQFTNYSTITMGNKNCFSGSSIKYLPDHCAFLSETNASFKLIPYQQFLYLWSNYLIRFSVNPDFSAVEVAVSLMWFGEASGAKDEALADAMGSLGAVTK